MQAPISMIGTMNVSMRAICGDVLLINMHLLFLEMMGDALHKEGRQPRDILQTTAPHHHLVYTSPLAILLPLPRNPIHEDS